MRPRFSDEEICFLLEVLRELETEAKRQLPNLEEEQEHLSTEVWLQRHKIFTENPYVASKKLKGARERLKALKNEWLFYTKRHVLLRGMIVRLEKIQARKRGRIPITEPFLDTYLAEYVPKNP